MYNKHSYFSQVQSHLPLIQVFHKTATELCMEVEGKDTFKNWPVFYAAGR